jgi:class 3 adenylate cyclase
LENGHAHWFRRDGQSGRLAPSDAREGFPGIGPVIWRGESWWHRPHPVGARGFFTALPLMKDTRQVGTLVLSEYPDEYAESEDSGLALKTALGILLPFLAEAVNARALAEEKKRIALALAGFVPERIFQRLVKGQTAREEDRGHLLMADLRESTRIAGIIGAEGWIRVMRALQPAIERIATDHGYTVQLMNWDAFYFTRPTAPSPEETARAIAAARALHALFDRVYVEHFGKQDIRLPELSSRFCLVHGDTTRDVSNGLKHTWQIIGTAMAQVTKLEQTAKLYSGWFFATASAFSQGGEQTGWSTLVAPLGATGDRIHVGELPERCPSRDSRELEEILQAALRALAA